MKVFSRDKYIEKMGSRFYYENPRWIDKCHMKTPEECKPFSVHENWLVECREVQREAKIGEYVRVIEDSDGQFEPGDITVCVDEGVLLPHFKFCEGERRALDDGEYVVREIVEEEEKMENVKQLLKNGDMVITRNGEKYIFIKDYLGRDVFKNENGNYCDLSLYDDNLTVGLDDAFTVMEIKKPEHFGASWFNECYYRTKWKREEVKEMTVAEIEKELGYKVKVVKG